MTIDKKYVKTRNPFDRDIDNQVGVRDIQNYLIAALTDVDIFGR